MDGAVNPRRFDVVAFEIYPTSNGAALVPPEIAVGLEETGNESYVPATACSTATTGDVEFGEGYGDGPVLAS